MAALASPPRAAPLAFGPEGDEEECAADAAPQLITKCS